MRGAQLKEVLQGVHEQRLAEAPWARDEQHIGIGQHDGLDERRLVNVVAVIANEIRKELRAERESLDHDFLEK